MMSMSGFIKSLHLFKVIRGQTHEHDNTMSHLSTR